MTRLDAPQRKYRNEPTVVEGLRFDSKAEARRWEVLRLRERAGEIRELRRQVRYALHVRDQAGELLTLGHYVADYVYVERASGQEIVEDVKSPASAANALYRWKKLHLWVEYGIEIREVFDER